MILSLEYAWVSLPAFVRHTSKHAQLELRRAMQCDANLCYVMLCCDRHLAILNASVVNVSSPSGPACDEPAMPATNAKTMKQDAVLFPVRPCCIGDFHILYGTNRMLCSACNFLLS